MICPSGWFVAAGTQFRCCERSEAIQDCAASREVVRFPKRYPCAHPVWVSLNLKLTNRRSVSMLGNILIWGGATRMDWKQFFAGIVGSLAWPAAVVIVVCIFKDQLRLLTGRIRRVGAGGWNVELSEKVEEAVDAGKLVQAEKGIVAPDVIGLDPTLLQLAKSFPEAALIQSFKELEALILEIRGRLPDGRPYRNLYEVMKVLEKSQFIPSSAVALFQSLREARNAAAHGNAEEELSSGESLDLIRQIKLLQAVLMPVLDQLPTENSRV